MNFEFPLVFYTYKSTHFHHPTVRGWASNTFLINWKCSSWNVSTSWIIGVWSGWMIAKLIDEKLSAKIHSITTKHRSFLQWFGRATEHLALSGGGCSKAHRCRVSVILSGKMFDSILSDLSAFWLREDFLDSKFKITCLINAPIVYFFMYSHI